jgi:hypothetical protein
VQKAISVEWTKIISTATVFKAMMFSEREHELNWRQDAYAQRTDTPVAW